MFDEKKLSTWECVASDLKTTDILISSLKITYSLFFNYKTIYLVMYFSSVLYIYKPSGTHNDVNIWPDNAVDKREAYLQRSVRKNIVNKQRDVHFPETFSGIVRFKLEL